MISRFFTWLETYVDSFPMQQAEKPAATLFAFAFHYTRPFLPLLVASILFSTVIALIEVYLFAFIGNLVDLLSTADRATPSPTSATRTSSSARNGPGGRFPAGRVTSGCRARLWWRSR